MYYLTHFKQKQQTEKSHKLQTTGGDKIVIKTWASIQRVAVIQFSVLLGA